MLGFPGAEPLIFSRTFCLFVILELLLHAYFEYFLD